MNSTPQTANAADRCVRTTDIALPTPVVSVSQDREWCVVDVGGQWKKIRFHDYDEIYTIPGLYEALFYDVLKCNSPKKIREMLQHCLNDAGVAPNDLQVLDLGAGNGMVGEELAGLGVRGVVGVDIIPAAADAARRDRGEFYDDYFVLDMTDLSSQDRALLSGFAFNCLTCVAALGFGDIPPAAFGNAYNLVVNVFRFFRAIKVRSIHAGFLVGTGTGALRGAVEGHGQPLTTHEVTRARAGARERTDRQRGGQLRQRPSALQCSGVLRGGAARIPIEVRLTRVLGCLGGTER